MKRHTKLSIWLLVMFTLFFTGYNLHIDTTRAGTYTAMNVHYIDTGESDSILITSNGHNMLIDAGDVDDVNTVVNYLKKQKVNKLDYIVLTHPHADHIGAAAKVIDTFEIGKIIMPNKSNNTKVYENLLDTIAKNKLKITKPIVGTSYVIGKAKFTLLAPNSYSYGSNYNNYSISLRLVNGNNRFLFVGDCETDAIHDILNNKQALDSDVLLCGHHGSNTSTTAALLDAVKPKYAVISVGKNSYGHPSVETLSLLKKHKITTYRTDENGTIIAKSSGKNITFSAKATDLDKVIATTKPSKATKKDKNTTNNSTVVYITNSGKKYHKTGCRYLKSSKIKTTIAKIKNKGYTPCKVCNP